jgi:hypothetical protein
MARGDDEDVSYSEARRRMGLDHVRAARQRIEDAERPEAVGRRHPSQPSTETETPPPVLPIPETTVAAPPEPAVSLGQQVADLTAIVAELAAGVQRLTEAHSTDLANATDALAAKYEMELAAHRQTVERLLEQQDAHIQTLNGLVEKLTRLD